MGICFPCLPTYLRDIILQSHLRDCCRVCRNMNIKFSNIYLILLLEFPT